MTRKITALLITSIALCSCAPKQEIAPVQIESQPPKLVVRPPAEAKPRPEAKHYYLSTTVLNTIDSGNPHGRDLYSDTWSATDALGRTMPDISSVGPVRKDQRRVVGIFYVTWHDDSRNTLKSPYAADVSRVLAGDPNARLDAKHPLWTEGSYHWGEPEAGYFLSKDEYVIRKDMSMLADAGVDVLVMDVTNAVRYWDEWSVVL